MDITEAEAATKWCPFAKRNVYASAKEHEEIAMQGIHPDYGNEMAARFPCIGSQCMAWRRDRRAFMVVFEGKPEERWSWDPRTSDSPYYADVKVREVDYGHCGLAA